MERQTSESQFGLGFDAGYNLGIQSVDCREAYRRGLEDGRKQTLEEVEAKLEAEFGYKISL